MAAVGPASLNRIVGAVLALAVAFTLGFVVRSQLPVERESGEALEAAAIEVLRDAAQERQPAAREAASAARARHSMMLAESKSLPMGLSEAAVDAVKQWKFTPAMVDGTPVPANHNVTVSFRLGKVG